MPSIEHELTKLSRSRSFAIFDLSHGYWQLSLPKFSQEYQSIITPDVVYIPTSVIHRRRNAVMYLPSKLATLIPNELLEITVWWLDDMFLHANKIGKQISAVAQFFSFCFTYNSKLHHTKCTYFGASICWGGQTISREKVTIDSRQNKCIQKISAPLTGADAQQFYALRSGCCHVFLTFLQFLDHRLPYQKKCITLLDGERARRQFRSHLLRLVRVKYPSKTSVSAIPR